MGHAIGTRLGSFLRSLLGFDLCPRGAAFTGTPDTILQAGEKKAWYRADQGISLNGTRVSTWANIWTNGNLVQGTANNQPLFKATGLYGKPCVSNDDGNRLMRCAALTSPIAVGNRSYMWLYGRVNTVPNTSKLLATVAYANGVVPRMYLWNQAASPYWWQVYLGDNNGHSIATSIGLRVDTNRHLFETGLTTNGTDQLVISGTRFTVSTVSAIAGNPMSQVVLYGYSSTSGLGLFADISELVLMQGEPTAQQKTDMREYFRTYYGSL
jgi:hypothetical protein